MTAAAPQVATGRRYRLAIIMLTAVVTSTLTSCSELMPLSSEEAWHETSPARGHPIGHADRTEYLDIEAPPHGSGLSRNQFVDVYRFGMGFKEQSMGAIAISAPGSVRGGQVVADVRRALDEAGIDPARIVRGRPAKGRVVTLAYRRPVAVAPECGHWPRDVGRERERVPYPDFGCATQRNLAGMVANSRDLIVSQEETDASSERRSRVWSKYVGAETSSPKPGNASDVSTDALPKASKK